MFAHELCHSQKGVIMSHPKLLVLDDYEGQLAIAPAMNRLRELADVTILNYPLAADDMHQLKPFQVD
jgi:hypothetical protein